jgi:plastocyanin
MVSSFLAASSIFLGAPQEAGAANSAVMVGIDNFTFTPADLTIAPGTTVTWINHDDIPHTVVETGTAFRSKALDTDDKFSFTFTAAGKFSYFCSLHPHMTGKITVTP